ncbi:hypothetical protein ATCC90586_004661 [Pythium insidiosum]|nr:hypothetical protein ATCC90586_004661 [Pythium insidiosum]
MPTPLLLLVLPLLVFMTLVAHVVHGRNYSLIEEDPLGWLFTTDASLAADNHRLIEPDHAFTLEQLQTAKPGLIHHLKPIAQATTGDEYRMHPVRVIHARAVSDMPAYDYIYDRFISHRGAEQGIKGFEAAMDSVTTASLEGVMYFVQTEVVNQLGRTVTTRCRRKHDIKYIAFYELLIVQPNEALGRFQDNETLLHEYGPFVAFEQGRCTPSRSTLGVDEIPDECRWFNGNDGRPAVGPFVGAVVKANDTYAPYENALWFSFPHTCPLQPWTAKTPECRAATRRGLCDAGVLPDGVHCVYTHRILGFIPLDDVTGITTLINNATQQPYGNFSEFCRLGGVEFSAITEPGGFFFLRGLPFWQHPVDVDANARRVQQLIDAYNALTGPNATESPGVHPRMRDKMRPLPTLRELRESNPPCYLNVQRCATAPHGCRRETYAQICRVCSAPLDGCVKAPVTFRFPSLHEENAAGGQGETSNVSDPAEAEEVVEPSVVVPIRSLAEDEARRGVLRGALLSSVVVLLLLLL